MRAYENYRDMEIVSGDPVHLVCMLYRGAVRAAQQAAQLADAGDIEGRSAAAARLMNIVTELIGSLNRQRGGDLARNLAQLYDYMLRRAIDGQLTQSSAPFVEIERLLANILQSWEQVDGSPRNEESTATGPELLYAGRGAGSSISCSL